MTVVRMFLYNGRRSKLISRVTLSHARRSISNIDGRKRLNDIWTPTILKAQDGDSSHDLLVRAGFIRQAHSGIFHILPLGLRVLEKIERLIDKHMTSLGASKVSLSSLSSEDIWAQSGRLEGRDSEFFRVTDRKGAKFLLSPTHEEEITNIVANAVHSHKDLPLRLYQVSRKYRDEARPRHGLLRGREFLMKDLYTFDTTEEHAKSTYEAVRKAYRAFLDELKLPYLVADAASGKMGGNLSHEYHFITRNGEDEIINCKSCGYAINEELFVADYKPSDTKQKGKSVYGISNDRQQMIKVILPEDDEINYHAVKRILPQLDLSIEDPLAALEEAGSISNIVTLVDPRCQGQNHARLDGKLIQLSKAQPGDNCPNCSANLHIDRAVEIGHTFHLSTRYSAVLNAHVMDADNKPVPVQMGCHGIGVSRLVAAIVSLLQDEKGLNWPMAVAPFQTVLVPTNSASDEDINTIYDALPVETVIDSRPKSIGWKLNDADLVGYPFMVIVGRKWKDEQIVELQCRRMHVKEEIDIKLLPARILDLARNL